MTESMPRRRISAIVLLLALVLAAVTGCTVPGNALPEYPDPRSFDAGSYRPEPLAEPAGNEKYGRVVESVRMAEMMIDPSEVESTLIFSANANGVLPVPTPTKARMLLAEPAGAVLEREGMLAGCAVAGTDREKGNPAIGEARVLTVIVLRFPDAEAARRAARDIDAVDIAVNAENVSVPIADYPDAHAHWRPSVPTLAATLAAGSYVVSLLIGHTSADIGVLSGMATKAFAAQVSRAQRFSATPQDRIAALPLDQDGMIQRLVPDAPDRWSYPAVVVATTQRDAAWSARIIAYGVVYGPRGAWLWGGRRIGGQTAEVFATNSGAGLVRYTTAAAARATYVDAARQDSLDRTVRDASGPAGVPDVSCTEHPTAALYRYVCRVVFDRYLATILARDLTTMHQKIVAQYGLLVNGA